MKHARQPLCLIIAGPNGAGKTTFARYYLPHTAKILHFANADLIAAGISPLKPELAAITAGKVFLRELERLAEARLDFAFESTLSGLTYVSRLRAMKAAGYRIEIIYLKLASPELSLKRVTERVKQGGHAVPENDIRRRFPRSWKNFETVYRSLADATWVFDATPDTPQLLES